MKLSFVLLSILFLYSQSIVSVQTYYEEKLNDDDEIAAIALTILKSDIPMSDTENSSESDPEFTSKNSLNLMILSHPALKKEFNIGKCPACGIKFTTQKKRKIKVQKAKRHFIHDHPEFIKLMYKSRN